MSSPDNRSPEKSGAEGTTPVRGKFNVTRTNKIAKAGVPLVSPGGDTAVAAAGSGSTTSRASPITSPAARPIGFTPPPPLPETTAPPAGLSSIRSTIAARSTPSPTGTPPLVPQRPPNVCVSRGPTPPAEHGTPPLAPRATPVPLITPRYQKKSRTNRAMEVTDSFSERGTNANQLRRQHATEQLTVTNGPQQYQQEVHFHTYELYRHGSRHIHSRSVGYSSDGDLVMTREDYSEPSDVDNSVTRVQTVMSNPIVLDPSARRPLTDSEVNSKRKLHLRRPRYKKYPGIYTPRNKKLRNRLMNDYFMNEQAMRLLNAARQRRGDDDIDDDAPVLKPSFADLPEPVLRAFDLADEAQERELERLGATRSPATNYVQPPRDPDAADTRFQKLNLRLRGELQHALGSEFLSRQIEDLEVCFSEYIDRGPTAEALVFHFRDGYGRLVCHGVAAYYQLVSESRLGADGTTKLTYVSFSKSKKAGIRAVNLPHAPLMHVLRGNKSSVPARHPLSTNATPVQAAQATPTQSGQPVPNNGGDGERYTELEPMSPLDLNASDNYANVPQAPPVAAVPEGSAAADPFSPCDPSRTIVSSASSSTLAETAVDGSHREVLVNPTVVMTVQGRLPITDIPVYAPQLQLKQLTLLVDPVTGCKGDSGDDHQSMPHDSAQSCSSSTSGDDDE